MDKKKDAKGVQRNEAARSLYGGAGPSKTEALRAKAESTSVGELMSRQVMCLAPEAEIAAVTEMFLNRSISSAPIVDKNWHPLGMVSKTDLLRVLAEQGDVSHPLRLAVAPESGEDDEQEMTSEAEDDDATPAPEMEGRPLHVGEITMPYVLTLHEEAPISVAAALMAYEGVHRLPIVASDGEVVGMLSTLDIVRWMARCTDLDVSGGEPRTAPSPG